MADQPPIEMISTRPAETSSRRITSMRVILDAAFLRFGCSIRGSDSAMARDHTISRARVRQIAGNTRIAAGVAELADARGLGPRGETRGGSSPSARIRGGDGGGLAAHRRRAPDR